MPEQHCPKCNAPMHLINYYGEVLCTQCDFERTPTDGDKQALQEWLARKR
jgi:uncharacterized Zn finger protein (UPF0148 family)